MTSPSLPKLSATHTHILSRYWLILAISALALAGLFSLPPVILRGPYFSDMLPVELIFSTALVLHVDLSVLVWMLAMAGFLWSLLIPKSLNTFSYGALFAASAGTLIITLSPFLGATIPLKNNYIPVIVNLPFMLGLALFLTGILIQACLVLSNTSKATSNPIFLGIYCSAIITIFSFLNFFLSYMIISPFEELGALSFYEHLFWGGGHSLQFTYTAIMVVAWLCCVASQVKTLSLNTSLLRFFICFNVAAIIITPTFYLTSTALEDTTPLFTEHMRYLGGITPSLIALMIVSHLIKTRQSLLTPIIMCTYLSLLLFFVGGGLALIIEGSNAIIPAHYHGSIVAITLSLMGMCYWTLPQLGFTAIPKKLSYWQPPIYGIGQLMHISGLAMMGGYGALRKAPGTSQDIPTTLGKLLFFSGGGLAIIGGLLFVIIALMAIGRK